GVSLVGTPEVSSVTDDPSKPAPDQTTAKSQWPGRPVCVVPRDLAPNAASLLPPPLATFRGKPRSGATDVIRLLALTFVMVEEVKATVIDLEFLRDDLLAPKDLQHGIVSLTIHEDNPREFFIDDPEIVFEIIPRGSGGADVQQISLSSDQFASALRDSQAAASSLSNGLLSLQQQS